MKNIEGGEILENKKIKKKGKLGFFLKVSGILLVVMIVTLTVYYISGVKFTKIVLSTSEIMDPNQSTMEQFKANDLIFFNVDFADENIKSNSLEIELFIDKDGKYVHYKKVSFEIEPKYQSLGASFPRKYFSIPGKYRVDVLLDGKVTRSINIEIK